MANPYLSIIIPAYNEEKRLPKTLRAINEYLRGAKYDYEILVVNDGSKDNTAEVVRSMEGEIKNLSLLDNAVNQGKGSVVREGMLKARGEIRLFTDADDSTTIDHFEKMQPIFHKGYDVVIGSRAVRGAFLDPPQPIVRRIPGKIGNLIIQVLVLPGIWDTQCGFKAFRAEVATEVFKRSKINGWGFDVECLALARKMAFKIKEIPVHWVNDTSSRVKASAYLQVLMETIRIRLRLWTNAYGIRGRNT